MDDCVIGGILQSTARDDGMSCLLTCSSPQDLSWSWVLPASSTGLPVSLLVVGHRVEMATVGIWPSPAGPVSVTRSARPASHGICTLGYVIKLPAAVTCSRYSTRSKRHRASVHHVKTQDRASSTTTHPLLIRRGGPEGREGGGGVVPAELSPGGIADAARCSGRHRRSGPSSLQGAVLPGPGAGLSSRQS